MVSCSAGRRSSGRSRGDARLRFFTNHGSLVAGYGPPGPGEPPSWRSYVATDDADGVATRVRDAGGMVMLEPMDVMDAGRMSVFVDSVGAVCGVWQAGQHRGAQIFNEPVSLSWNQLNCRDPEAAKSFYSAVFGWEGKDTEGGEIPYTQWFLPGREAPVGGMIDMRGRVPDEIPPHWMVYFAVADTDVTTAKAEELGGQVTVPPIDLPVGRFAVLTDPNGAHFAVIRLNPQ